MCLCSWDYAINHNENDNENEKWKIARCGINTPRSRRGCKYSKYITCITMMMLMFVK